MEEECRQQEQQEQQQQQQQQQQQTLFSGDGAQGARGGASRPPPRPWLQACELPGYTTPGSQRRDNNDEDGSGADSRNSPWPQPYGGGAGQTRRMPASNERLGRALEQLEEIQNSAAHLGQQLRQVMVPTFYRQSTTKSFIQICSPGRRGREGGREGGTDGRTDGERERERKRDSKAYRLFLLSDHKPEK